MQIFSFFKFSSVLCSRCARRTSYRPWLTRRWWTLTQRSHLCPRPRPPCARPQLPWRRFIITSSNSSRPRGSSPRPSITICNRNCTTSPPCIRTPWYTSRITWTRPLPHRGHHLPALTRLRTPNERWLRHHRLQVPWLRVNIQKKNLSPIRLGIIRRPILESNEISSIFDQKRSRIWVAFG